MLKGGTMNQLKVVYMGTPDFAVPTLKSIIEAGHHVVGVFCQPDKEKGRGKKIQMPAVKEVALEYNLPVYQPLSLRNDEAESLLKKLAPDLIVVVAYGKILPPWLISLPQYGCINVHASILPAYRGAAPIHWAILNGDQETGVTIMKMDNDLDTGDILHIEKVRIGEKETTGQLFDRLALLGGETINTVIKGLVDGSIKGIPQNHSNATFTQKITKEMGHIDWSKDAFTIAQTIRALNPAPGTYSFIEGKRLKLWMATGIDEVHNKKPGTIIKIDKDSFNVAAGHGIVRVEEVQPENKKRLNAGDYCRGYQLEEGKIFTFNQELE